MKKMRTPVPEPKSKFISVKCGQCGKENVIFSHTTMDIKCKACNSIIAERTGSRAKLFTKEVKVLD